jgi:hypothetical protein
MSRIRTVCEHSASTHPLAERSVYPLRDLIEGFKINKKDELRWTHRDRFRRDYCGHIVDDTWSDLLCRCPQYIAVTSSRSVLMRSWRGESCAQRLTETAASRGEQTLDEVHIWGTRRSWCHRQ